MSAVRFKWQRLPPALYVNLTVIKSMSTHVTGAVFIYRLCSTIQTDAQGQSEFDEALTWKLTLHTATNSDTGFEWQGLHLLKNSSFDYTFTSMWTSDPGTSAVIICLPYEDMYCAEPVTLTSCTTHTHINPLSRLQASVWLSDRCERLFSLLQHDHYSSHPDSA